MTRVSSGVSTMMWRWIFNDPARTEDGHLVLGYDGLDGVRRATTCEVTGAEARWEGSRAILDLVFAPQEERTVDVVVTCESGEASQARCTEYVAAEASREREHRLWQVECASFQSGDEPFGRVIAQAQADIFLLLAGPGPARHRSRSTRASPGSRPCSGATRSSRRAGCCSSLGLARACCACCRAAGVRDEPRARRRPGKIIHGRATVRWRRSRCPSAAYGSVDSTLFCMLLGAYAFATGDLDRGSGRMRRRRSTG
jgi:hypothetical protein